MALVTKIERPEDMDIPKAYSRITGVHIRRPVGTSGTITFTLIEYDTYMSKNTRTVTPGTPVRIGDRVKIEDWTPSGTSQAKVMESVYAKLADNLGIENVKV